MYFYMPRVREPAETARAHYRKEGKGKDEQYLVGGSDALFVIVEQFTVIWAKFINSVEGSFSYPGV